MFSWINITNFRCFGYVSILRIIRINCFPMWRSTWVEAVAHVVAWALHIALGTKSLVFIVIQYKQIDTSLDYAFEMFTYSLYHGTIVHVSFYNVSFYNSTASSWTLATPRTTWESMHG